MTAPEPRPDALRLALEAAGCRCTPQRRAVYEVLTRADHHPTADEVYRGVRADLPHISLATVYKALEALVACGLAARMSSGDGPASAPARYDARGEGHYHARCLRTGAVRDLPTPFDPGLLDKLDPGLTERLAAQGFRVTGYRLELVGYDETASPGPPPDRGPVGS